MVYSFTTCPSAMTVVPRCLFIGLVCASYVSSAAAMREPDSDAYDGKWNVSIQGEGKSPLRARLELAKFAGTWHDLDRQFRARSKNCKGTKFAVTVQNSVAAAMEFTIWGSSVSSDCPDISATVQPSSDTVLVGMLETGETIRLTRP